ncbi:hypothetical protein PtrM4_126700 [Pyrenophora tritici-repentis]|uniref:Uncharacterized protein n=1 Tax=Pyrenophora tritici-repentis TaxID=45151 RepID=A0A834VNB0_9PLEO|nr:hypothetical protein PtrM4_126700 [Pyrenophora tritici-repentis]
MSICFTILVLGCCNVPNPHAAISSTCLPLPTDPLSRAFPLLSPIRHKTICALGPERFELRTAGLGCQVSTITFLTSIVTIFCTLFGVLVLYGLSKCIGLLRLGARAKKGGYVLYEDGTGEVWVRKSEGWGKWWRRFMGEEKEFEIEEVDDGTRKRGFFLWNTRDEERRPLLE